MEYAGKIGLFDRFTGHFLEVVTIKTTFNRKRVRDAAKSSWFFEMGSASKCFFEKSLKIYILRECYVKSQMPVEEVREKDMKICSFCNQMKLIESNGRCAACRYRVILSTQQQQNGNKRENLRLCNVCKTMKKHCCRGMCQQCYYLEVTKKKLQAAGLLKNT
jgi:hypothetical protein